MIKSLICGVSSLLLVASSSWATSPRRITVPADTQIACSLELIETFGQASRIGVATVVFNADQFNRDGMGIASAATDGLSWSPHPGARGMELPTHLNNHNISLWYFPANGTIQGSFSVLMTVRLNRGEDHFLTSTSSSRGESPAQTLRATGSLYDSERETTLTLGASCAQRTAVIAVD